MPDIPQAAGTQGNERRVGGMRPALALVFLTVLNILSFADRFLMQGFAVDLMADLHLSYLQFTLLTGFIFTVFSTLAGLFMGALADRLHRPRLVMAGLSTWSVLTIATGMARGFLQIALARTFIGVGEATLTPAAIGLLGDVFSRKHRAFASGFYYLGAPLGIGGAFVVAGTFGAAAGWRNCFYILGLLGLILMPLLLWLREPRAALHASDPPRPSIAAAFRQIWPVLSGSPALRLVILGGVLVIFAQGALVLDQVWLVEERGFGKAQAQKLAGLVFLAGGAFGAVLGGIGSDIFQRRRAAGRLHFLALAYGIGMPVGLLYRFTDPAGAAFYLCMFIGSITLTIGYGPLFAAVQDLVPDRVRSTMVAFMILCMTLLGTSPGNLLVGWLADVFRAAAVAEPITKAILVGTMPALLAIPCFYRAAKKAARGSWAPDRESARAASVE